MGKHYDGADTKAERIEAMRKGITRIAPRRKYVALFQINPGLSEANANKYIDVLIEAGQVEFDGVNLGPRGSGLTPPQNFKTVTEQPTLEAST